LHGIVPKTESTNDEDLNILKESNSINNNNSLDGCGKSMKSKIISELYSLRAGISLVYLHINDYNNISSQLKELDNVLSIQIDKKEREMKEYNDSIYKLNSDYNNQKQKLSDHINYLQKQTSKKSAAEVAGRVVATILLPFIVIPAVLEEVNELKEAKEDYPRSINNLNRLKNEYDKAYNSIKT
jgi:DNA-binding ferritin-like protein (Dps family)